MAWYRYEPGEWDWLACIWMACELTFWLLIAIF